MTGFTPNFNLPYPTALDEPCDFAEQWCDFTTAVNAVATRFETTVNRTIPTIPMARMTLTVPIVILDGGLIPFDSVSVNTAGWVDFDASNTDIVTDRAGYFVVNATVLLQTTGVPGTTLTIRGNTGLAREDTQLDRNTSSLGLCINYITNPTSLQAHNVLVQRSGTGNIQINAACFSVYWHADTATP